MTIELTQLPYAQDALEPHISARTFSYHYGKHHRAYVDKLNELTANTPLAGLSLEEIVDKARETASTGILNNALQVWNHAFLWESMSPDGGGNPDGRLKEMIERDFGDIGSFKEQFALAALSRFGSGWVWLVQEGSTLRIMTTGNADSPLNTESNPLLTLDVWEHAYYLDFQNDRKGYTDTFLEHLINWDFAAANLQD